MPDITKDILQKSLINFIKLSNADTSLKILDTRIKFPDIIFQIMSPVMDPLQLLKLMTFLNLQLSL